MSWFSDYQARRANLRFKPEGGKGTEVLHTCNGSALAVPRAQHRRRGARRAGRDEAGRARHDLGRGRQGARGAGERVQDQLPRLREGATVDG